MHVNANLNRLAALAVSDAPFFLRQTRKRLRRAARPDYRWIKSGRANAPISVSIEVTHKCNLRCYMCDLYGTDAAPDTVRAHDERPEEVFTDDEDRGLVEQLAWFRPTLSLTGGEPFVTVRAMRLLRLAREYGLATAVVTNGMLLTRDAEEIVDAGLDSITVSIDGPKDIHDSIRGVPGSFARAIEGTEKLRSVKAARGSAKPHIEINTTICGRNCRELSAMPAIAEGLGVERLQFSHLWFWHPEQVAMHNSVYGKVAPCTVQNIAGLEGIDVRVLADEIEKIRWYDGPLAVKFLPDLGAREVAAYYREPLTVVKQSRCVAPWLTTRIMPNGDVIPCLDVKIGNLREAPFAELWNNESYRGFRKLVQKNRLLPGCLRCCELFCY